MNLHGMQPASLSSAFALAGLNLYSHRVAVPSAVTRHELAVARRRDALQHVDNVVAVDRVVGRLADAHILERRRGRHAADSPSCADKGCVMIVMPADLSRGIVSGDGASMKSTWPDSSAAARVDASGIGSSTSRSCFGMRFLSQYSAFFTSSSRSCGTTLSNL